MKKIGWSILIGLFTVVSLTAQETKKQINNTQEEITFMPKHVIKVYPIDALFGGIGLGYERAISPKLSLDFEVFQGFNKPDFVNSTTERSYRLFFETELRYYLSKRKNALEGWFVSGGLITQYNYDKLRNNTTDQITNLERLRVGGSLKTGYQWIFKKALKGFTAEAMGGIGYKTVTGILDGGASDTFDVQFNFTIGYSW